LSGVGCQTGLELCRTRRWKTLRFVHLGRSFGVGRFKRVTTGPAVATAYPIPSKHLKARRHGYQRILRPLSLWTPSQNRTTVGLANHTSAPSLPRLPCLALHPCALPVHPPPTTAKASALASLMSGVANRNVTSKCRITPVRSIAAPREGAPAESNNHRVQTGCAQCVLLMKQF
jgi:hypothetical protein